MSGTSYRDRRSSVAEKQPVGTFAHMHMQAVRMADAMMIDVMQGLRQLYAADEKPIESLEVVSWEQVQTALEKGDHDGMIANLMVPLIQLALQPPPEEGV